MQLTKEGYFAFSYGVPFGAFALIFAFITVIHKRVDWFLLHTILGVDWNLRENDKTNSNQSKSSEIPIGTYLYVNIGDDELEDISPLNCIIRFFSDVLASAILAVFVAIMFDSLIMSNQRLSVGTKCPSYSAECFGTNGGTNVGPFNCSDGQYANFSVDSTTVWCAGWIYQDRTINDVLDTLGTCGGLLGIISSIVPFVYYLSYYKRNCYLSAVCIILPLLPVAALSFTIWFTLPEGPSQLTIVVFSVVIAMVFIGWCWAVYRSYSADESSRDALKKYSCCRKILGCSSCKICYPSRNGCLWKKYKFYPWCCIYRRCMRRCCFHRWNHNWRRRCEEEDKQHDSASLTAMPVYIEYPQRSVKQSVLFKHSSDW